ncbi:uncharacterized protein C8Q71DRAFT_286637 [Rhodofomes roseus]|uniref:OBG-type G domain-containing protein n=1 Tax=Rhodofomes roseus TaxID=34475 RepID=A0ABQ8K4N1_9APHY|nr:uncharacterized protein C8Q71DRAFT_286637 [Rhodofomes roseus]KAH9831826.1 hypothetical protein C8Q71DRAFT_286637 [Rhodofomes roseus]
MNLLYDKNHFKLALGQLRTARHLIDQVTKKSYGDHNAPAEGLSHIRRGTCPAACLPSSRNQLHCTLLICGYPNVGKSSFINNVTRADVDVQPFAFTAKSLFVGHLE